jgi:hypothetical protein
MLRISESVDGASVAAATSSSARAMISIVAVAATAAANEATPNAAATDHDQPAAADPIAERAHRDEANPRAGSHMSTIQRSCELLGRRCAR